MTKHTDTSSSGDLVGDDFAPIWDESILLAEHEAVQASVDVGGWLSAALDDPNVCDAMKTDINRWFSAGFLYLNEVRKLMQTEREALEAQIDRLASFIIHCIEGEPSQDQGAVDTAIRIMTEQATTIGEQLAENERLRRVLEAVWKEATTMRNASKLVGPYPKEPANNRVWARSMYHAGKKLHELIKPVRAALGEKQ